ncbi:hypothetical protein [Rhodococcus sp. ACT016]|uniref:hypothetical protein n=1 Tax=Rhodococcus sp. ACT016 TaxID=3134808 RepID=UPI003D2A554D
MSILDAARVRANLRLLAHWQCGARRTPPELLVGEVVVLSVVLDEIVAGAPAGDQQSRICRISSARLSSLRVRSGRTA